MRKLHLKWDVSKDSCIGHLYFDPFLPSHKSLGTIFAKDDKQKEEVQFWFDAANTALENVHMDTLKV
jgi:hypothetical protein